MPSRRVFWEGTEGGINGESLFNGYKVLALQDEKFLKFCSTALCLQLPVLYCTLKIVLIMMAFFYYNRKSNDIIPEEMGLIK